MYLILFDGLDSLIEWLIPAAREYPIASFIYLAIVAVPVLAVITILRLLFRLGRHDKYR